MIERCGELLVDIVNSYKTGNIASREKLISLYSDSACKIASKYFGLGVEEEDLIQVAYEGLVVAVDECRYKEVKNYSYQILRRTEDFVRQAIGQNYVSYSGERFCNSYIGGMTVNILKLKRNIMVTEGRVPSNEEIRKKLNIHLTLVNDIIEVLDRNCGNIADLSFEDLRTVVNSVQDVEWEMQCDYDRSHIFELAKRKIAQISLSPSERRLLGCFRNGIINIYEQRDTLKISRQRILELRKRIACKLRKAILKELGEVVDSDSSMVAYENERVLMNKIQRDRAQNRHRY